MSRKLVKYWQRPSGALMKTEVLTGSDGRVFGHCRRADLK